MKKEKLSSKISLYGGTSQEDGTWSLFCLVPVFYLILGVYGWLRTALTLSGVGTDSVRVCAAVLLSGLWFGVLALLKRRRAFWILLTLAAAAVLSWYGREAVAEGFAGIKDAFFHAMETKMEGGAVESEGMLAALLLVMLLDYCIFLLSFCSESGKYLAVLWMALPVGLSFAFGIVPDGVGVLCMVFSALGLFVCNGEMHNAVKGQSAMLAGFFALLVFVLGSAAARPMLAPVFSGKEETRERIRQTSLIQEMLTLIPDWNGMGGTVASGGVSEGDINDTDFFADTDEVLFSVSGSEQPEENLYLRVYTGAEYTKKKWEAIGDTEPAAGQFYERAAHTALQYGYDTPQKLSVKFGEEARKNRNYPYAPYFSRTVEQAEAAGPVYEYYPVEELGPLFSGADYGGTEEYRDYVYEHYLDYPAQRLPGLLEFCHSNPCGSLEEVCRTVRDMLSENTSYNMQVGRFPEEEDFAEYFVFEKKEGFCVHYATASVLLMRMYGIPARYVTGFMVPAGDFEWDGVEYTAQVDGGRAHAWAEIYVEPFGWIPYETTPAYDSGARLLSGTDIPTDIPVQESGQAETESAGMQRQDQTQTDTPDKTVGRKEDGKALQTSAKAGGAVATSVGGMLLLVFAVLFLFFRRGILLERRRKQGVPGIFQDLYEVLEFAGMPGSPDCMEPEFLDKVTEQFVWIDQAELAKVVDIAMRAAFSEEKITKEEVLQVRGMYRHVCRTLLKGMKGWKRFRFRFLKAYL